ncbi:uncharacterized protein [Musca autumnalis]|uniref:uncharacterized protein n=1 Tax=Musca autumnalis TaxID=221902 RepID=UPI003CF7A588
MPYKRKSRKYLCEAKHVIESLGAVQNIQDEAAFDSDDEMYVPERSGNILPEESVEGESPDVEERLAMVCVPGRSGHIVSEDSINVEPSDFQVRLARWVSVSNISNQAANNLLQLLAEKIPNLPKDVRALKSTPRSIVKRIVDPGEYVHYGIKDALTDFLSKCQYGCLDISLNVNIDGLPLFKSSLKQVWPILINVHGTKPVLVAGIYAGSSKPRDASLYLKEFVEELQLFVSEGMIYHNKYFNINIRAFVCDAPARAFILGTKYHSGFYSCNKCTQKGQSFQRRIIFLRSENVPRTDHDFRNRVYTEHHNIKDRLILENLPIDMVNQFPFDYMHVVCLGVMKTLLVALTRVRGHPFSLDRNKIGLISSKLLSLRKFIPKEIKRKPRSLKDLERFKASEFRTFLLYSGPIVLKDILDPARYKHFYC